MFSAEPVGIDGAIIRFANPGLYELTQIVRLIKTLRDNIILQFALIILVELHISALNFFVF